MVEYPRWQPKSWLFLRRFKAHPKQNLDLPHTIMSCHFSSMMKCQCLVTADEALWSSATQEMSTIYNSHPWSTIPWASYCNDHPPWTTLYHHCWHVVWSNYWHIWRPLLTCMYTNSQYQLVTIYQPLVLVALLLPQATNPGTSKASGVQISDEPMMEISKPEAGSKPPGWHPTSG